jgi:hypothetical protein
MTDHGQDKEKRSAQVELCDVLKANMDSTLKMKTLGCVETAEDTRPATSQPRRLDQQRRLCENFNTDVLTPRNGVTQPVQPRIVMTVDIRHRTGSESQDYEINGPDGVDEGHSCVQCPLPP